MFGGAAISAEGVTFAIVAQEAIYLKVDDDSIPAFEQEGSQAFTYTRAQRGAKPIAMSYWRLPERLYDDPDELASWAERAFVIAQRAKFAPFVRKASKAGAAKRAPAKGKVAKRSTTRNSAGKPRPRR